MSETSVLNAFNYAKDNAGGFVDLAKAALEEAKLAVAKIGFDDVNWVPIALYPNLNLGDVPAPPEIVAPVLNLPDDPGNAPTLVQPSPIAIDPLPVNTAVVPVLNFPSAPSGIGLAPLAPTLNTDFVFPEPPPELSNALPQAPVLPNRTEPTAPDIILPSFMAQAPEHVGDAPTDAQGTMDAIYFDKSQILQANAKAYVDQWIDQYSPEYHSQMAAIEAQLSRYLAGGTGLDDAVENAIYERARGKNDADARRVRDQAYGDAAGRGFTLPTGALMSAAQSARQAAADNNARAAAEIVVMQAEMEQKNLQFAVSASTALRNAMIGAALSYMQNTISVNGQAIDYAKSVFSNIVELYNASIRVFTARIDAYKSYASVYETELRAALARLDVYKAEISALEAMTTVDRAKVDAYRAQIDATTAVVGLYRAQIEAVQGRVSLEKLKLDVFQTQVQAFGAEVQAKNSEWNGYNAALSGEESKVKIYSAQQSAFNSQLDGYRAVISARVAESESVTRTNQANASLYASTLQGYTARVGAEADKSRALNDNNRVAMTAYEKELSAFMSTVQLTLAKYKAESDARVQNATSDLTAQLETVKAKLSFGSTMAQLSNDGAHIYGQLASSAMAGMNSLAADINNT